MKRRLAKSVNECNKKINTEIEKSIKTVNDIGHKLLKDIDLNAENINEIGQLIIEQQNYNKNQLIVCDITRLNECLDLYKKSKSNVLPLFIICLSRAKVGAIFCIIEEFDRTICLGNDSSFFQITENIQNIFKYCFNKDIEFKICSRYDGSEDQKHENILSLKILETILISLQSDNKENFIKNFDNCGRILACKSENETVNIQSELFSLVKEEYCETIACDIEQLSMEREGFLREFQHFIDNLPEVPLEFIICSQKLEKINFDDWDIEESKEYDPRMGALEDLHNKMLASFDVYKTMGENYIDLRNQGLISNEWKVHEEKNTETVSIEMENIDINMFDVVTLPKVCNSFYSAVEDQLRLLEIKKSEIHSQPEAYYTYQDLITITIDYIKRHRGQKFCKDIEIRLKASKTAPLYGDLPENIHTIDQYIEIHSAGETRCDSGVVEALAHALNITLRIYNQDGTPTIYNTHPLVKKIINLQYISNHYYSLVIRPLGALPIEIKYPKQMYKVKRILEILNECKRGKELDKQIQIIARKLGLSQVSIDKLTGYFNASIIIKVQTSNKIEERVNWYNNNDMMTYGRVIEKHGVNFDSQFSCIFTDDAIKTLPSVESLIENYPKYICFNISGQINKDVTDGIHWIAIFLVKRGQRVVVLYKDSKGDYNNSSKAVQTLLKEHYGDKLDFIRHSRIEQEDDTGSGPMTINNLEIMARKVKETNDERKDGVSELIRSFQNESEGMVFSTQDQVSNIRISHSLQKKLLGNFKQDINVHNLRDVMEKLEFSNNFVSKGDGKNFEIVKITGNGDGFYLAVAEVLRRMIINKNEVDSSKKDLITNRNFRELTIDYLKKNREYEFVKNIEESLQIQDAHLFDSDLTPSINTLDKYIELHSKEGVQTDCGIIGALGRALDITIKIYHQDSKIRIYNTSQNTYSSDKNIVNLQYTGRNYNALIETNADDSASQKRKIISCIHQIDEYYNKLKDWGVEELRDWSRKHKGCLSKNFSVSQNSKNDICKAIAVMNRANEVATRGHILRETQKIAILIFIQMNTKGHISQINTGEGKTTIISVVAALRVMQGYKCHIITSNNVLAADGVEDKKVFYNLLNITVANNNPDDKYTDGPRVCYSEDVVYGSITSFQFDWLKDSFEKLKTLGSMDFNNTWVILDEIDSLLIDQGSNIAKLSSPFPGMETLRYVYINIWCALAEIEDEVTQQILTRLKSKANELAQDSETHEDKKQIKYEEYEDNLRESFLDDIKKQLKSRKDNFINKKILAKHLHQYAEDSIERWIEYAFSAKYQYHEDIEYKIIRDKNGEDVIIPVDNKNTGVTLKNTILSNGLHQFLQIKHNLCLTYESLTSCYVSNLDYIKKYCHRLSGLTGTLGSEPERNLLGLVFNLEFSVIPPFKHNKFIQFPGKISTDDEFVNDVAVAALGELARTQTQNNYLNKELPIERSAIKKPRAVLVICASILDVNIISQEIDREAEAAGMTLKVLKYRDEPDAYITHSTLDIGDIIVATNLAGRGTDLKTSTRLEDNGGLHVIEAFLPCNKRVEDQGLGRSGRQGNKGSGQIIVKISELEALGIVGSGRGNLSFEEIIACRDELECNRISDIANNKIRELEFKGQLFNKFSSLYGSLKENSHKNNDAIKWTYVLRDLKEKWAFWLYEQAYTTENIQEIINGQSSWFTNKEDHLSKAVDQEYNKFLKEAQPIFEGTISHNPFHSICLAERYLEFSIDKLNREKAKSELEHAIKISDSSELLYSAYIKLFEIAMEDGGQVLERYKRALARIIYFPQEKHCVGYKQHAIENLEKAKKALKIEHDYLEGLFSGNNVGPQHLQPVLRSIIMEKKVESEHNQWNKFKSNSNIFLKHLQSRLICLSVYKSNIESLIKQINGENELENPKDSIAANDGAIIDCKVTNYLNKLDSENELKNHITNRSVDELAYVGMSSIYQLRKIHDVHEEVIYSAQIQIAGAFALLTTAAAFPMLLPVNGPLAGAMISKGITDIITSLIQQGQTAFNKNDYIKGKIISYGISLLTMGICAVMSSTKILNKAMNVCRNLATKLRAVKGPFAGICKILAYDLAKLAQHLQFMIEKIEFARKTAAEQAKYLCHLKDINQLHKFQQLQKTLKISDVVMTQGRKIALIATKASIGAIKGVVISVAIEKVLVENLNNLMTGLKPKIEEKVYSAVSTRIKDESINGTFNNLSDLEVEKAIALLLDASLEEDIKKVSKKICLGILRHSSNWKIQLASLAFESILAGINVATCTEIILTGEVLVTLPKALYRGYKEHQENKADEKAITDIRKKLNQIDTADTIAKGENTKCVHDAVSKTLELGNQKGSKQLSDATNLVASKDGASVEDAKQLFRQNGIEVTSCTIENAQLQFNKQGSDRGIVCLNDNQGLGHAVAVTMEGDCLMVTEGEKTLSFDQYKHMHGFINAEFIIPKNVNRSTLPHIQHRCNLNRIANATYPINYIGQNDKIKFGRRSYTIYDSINPDEVGKTKGNASVKNQINNVEGKVITGNNPAHSRESHVGRIEGKTTFKDSRTQDNVFRQAKNCHTKKTVVITEEGGKTRRVTFAQIQEYEGYDWRRNKVRPSNRDFQYVKLVEYKNIHGQWELQTMFPCDKPWSPDWVNR